MGLVWCTGGADSWRDAALAHGITGFLVDLFIRNVCGDAQFRIRVQQHHDLLLLAAASSAPRVVHISTAKQENCGETDNGEMTECRLFQSSSFSSNMRRLVF